MMMLDPLIVRVLSVGFALLFLLAAAHKLTSFGKFKATLTDYQLLSPGLVNVFARLLPLFEIALGIGWLFAQQSFYLPVASAVLLYIYAVAIGINLMRGRSHIDCGCGFARSAGSSSAHQLSFSLVLRNLVLVAAALIALIPTTDRQLAMLDFVVLVMAVMTGVFLYAAANQLRSNSGIIGAWRNQRG